VVWSFKTLILKTELKFPSSLLGQTADSQLNQRVVFLIQTVQGK